jgi:site-specific DNA recombinase
MTMTTTRTRAAIYLRVSTEHQAEHGLGLPSQRRELLALAKRKGYRVTDEHIYEDKGISGAEIDRPALERLRAAVRARAVDVVLVHSADRLSRKLAHLVLLLDEFRRAGVRLEYATHAPSDTDEGVALEQMQGVFAELERCKIRERTMRGKREKARRGVMPGGRPPFGYRRDPSGVGGLGLEPGEAVIVRRIFSWFLAGTSMRGIAVRLGAQGIRRRDGSKWCANKVQRVLTNERYAGVACYNRLTTSVDGGLAVRPDTEWIRFPIPVIVSRTTFNRVRGQIARNVHRLSGRSGTHVHLLKGLLVCDACGSRWHGDVHHARWMYSCAGRDAVRGRGCRVGSRHADVDERDVCATVAGLLRDERALLAAVRAYGRDDATERGETADELTTLHKELTAVRTRKKRLIDLHVDGALTKTDFTERHKPLAAAESRLTREIAELEALRVHQDAEARRRESALAQVALLRRGLDRLDRVGWQDLLQLLVVRVRVPADGGPLVIEGLLPTAAVTPRSDVGSTVTLDRVSVEPSSAIGTSS